METFQRRGQAETTRLEALIRKAEMKSASLEKQLEQKEAESVELTKICDELIATVGGDGGGAHGAK